MSTPDWIKQRQYEILRDRELGEAQQEGSEKAEVEDREAGKRDGYKWGQTAPFDQIKMLAQHPGLLETARRSEAFRPGPPETKFLRMIGAPENLWDRITPGRKITAEYLAGFYAGALHAWNEAEATL